MVLKYDDIEEQLIDALPELRPAAERYWSIEGRPGEDCGPSIFLEDLFARYVAILLAMDTSPSRDRLLRRAFDFVEEMLERDDTLSDVAFVSVYDGRPEWWFARAARFIGERAKPLLDRNDWRWRRWAGTQNPVVRDDFGDFYGIREVIALELKADGVDISKVPGTDYSR